MSKANALAGLIGNYGDSDDESEDGVTNTPRGAVDTGAYRGAIAEAQVAAIHPAPIPHCPWSACYDETSGFTYYWNQLTNAVTWEAPPEYLLALKLAQQQLQSAGSEVSAEEWQLYQQALAEKQLLQQKSVKPVVKSESKHDKPKERDPKYAAKGKKRISCVSDDEDEKIELITSYYHSDSESNDETESPLKSSTQPKPQTQVPKQPFKKQKTKPTPIEYGPPLPPNQSYTVPIGPELPPNSLSDKPKSPEMKMEIVQDDVKNSPKAHDNDDNKDECSLLLELKDKAKLLEKLGGEIPSDLQKLIESESKSVTSSPKLDNKVKVDTPNNSQGDKSTSGTNTPITSMDTNIDDLLEEIEKKELPKAKKVKIDMFGDEEICKSNESSAKNSPRSTDDKTPPREEIKSLFPSSKVIVDEKPISLFPSAINIQENGIDKTDKTPPQNATEKKTNVYLMDSSEVLGNTSRKKLRISNSVLPVKKASELPSYTTKYSTHIEGFSTERIGLGFSKDEDDDESPKNTITYGKGLTFTKGEILNEDKKDEALDELTELVEAKLKYLNQLQPCTVTPVQEMLIQMQTLVGAFRFGALSGQYWRRWALAAARALSAHEAAAAPPGWTCVFQRSEGRYQYVRADGLAQWEYPAPQTTDMDICTTPPHPSQDIKDEVPLNPPLPETPPAAVPPPPPPPSECWSRARVETPPPPAWSDPPPPGTDDPPPLPPEQPKQEISDELLSFYNDIAELEKQTDPIKPCTPEPPPPPVLSAPSEPAAPAAPAVVAVPSAATISAAPAAPQAERKEGNTDKERDGKSKKKSKVKISSSMGIKHKSVSTLVAKWQQVADEIHSD